MERRLFIDAPCEGLQDDFVFLDRNWRYPNQAGRLQRCLDICDTCPYIVECANWAVLTETPLQGAVLGGMDPSQVAARRAEPFMVEARRWLNRSPCGTERAYADHRHFDEDCNICRESHTRRNNPLAA